jgi:hypothetical protein
MELLIRLTADIGDVKRTLDDLIAQSSHFKNWYHHTVRKWNEVRKVQGAAHSAKAAEYDESIESLRRAYDAYNGQTPVNRDELQRLRKSLADFEELRNREIEMHAFWSRPITLADVLIQPVQRPSRYAPLLGSMKKLLCLPGVLSPVQMELEKREQENIETAVHEGNTLNQSICDMVMKNSEAMEKVQNAPANTTSRYL